MFRTLNPIMVARTRRRTEREFTALHLRTKAVPGSKPVIQMHLAGHETIELTELTAMRLVLRVIDGFASLHHQRADAWLRDARLCVEGWLPEDEEPPTSATPPEPASPDAG